MSHTAIWKDKAQQDEFFERLRALVQEYPELMSFTNSSDAEDVADELNGTDYPAFDEQSPNIIRNVVLVYELMDVNGFWRVFSLDAWGQGAASKGLLSLAYDAE